MIEAKRGGKNRNNRPSALLAGIWLVLSLISINHIFKLVSVSYLSVTAIGLLGWGAIFLSLIVLSRRFWRKSLAVFVLFFSFGAWCGPFLEPPADSFEHLRRTHSYCDVQIDELPTNNKGFWHYSIRVLKSTKPTTA